MPRVLTKQPEQTSFCRRAFITLFLSYEAVGGVGGGGGGEGRSLYEIL